MKIELIVVAIAPILIVLTLQAYLMLNLNTQIDRLSLQLSTMGSVQVEVQKLPTLTLPQTGCEIDNYKKQIETF